LGLIGYVVFSNYGMTMSNDGLEESKRAAMDSKVRSGRQAMLVEYVWRGVKNACGMLEFSKEYSFSSA
jgi:hypothetical protein